MGRSRRKGAISYDLEVSREAMDALEALASEQDTTVAEIVRSQLLGSPENKERLVPKARKLIRHAEINVTVADGEE